MMMTNELLQHYRPNVGVTLFNRNGQVWFGKRTNAKTHDPEDGGDAYQWQMPQGGIDDGETPVEAAIRELEEETGVTSATLLTMTPGWLTYDFPAGYKRKNWRGQRQKWAAMLFNGDEAEIDLMADDPPEFTDWRWGELEEAPSLIVPFKQNVYRELMAAFAPLRDFIRDKIDH